MFSLGYTTFGTQSAYFHWYGQTAPTNSLNSLVSFDKPCTTLFLPRVYSASVLKPPTQRHCCQGYMQWYPDGILCSQLYAGNREALRSAPCFHPPCLRRGMDNDHGGRHAGTGSVAFMQGLVKELESLPRPAPPPPSSRRLSTNWHSPLFRGGSHKSANVFRGGGSQRNRLEANRNTTEGIQRTKDGFISLDILGVQLLRSFLEKDRSLTTHSSERARSRASPPPQRRRRQVLTGLGVVDDEGGDSGGDAAGSGRWSNQGERGVRDDGVGNPAVLSGYEMALCSRVRYLSRGVSALRIFWCVSKFKACCDLLFHIVRIHPLLLALLVYANTTHHVGGSMRLLLVSTRSTIVLPQKVPGLGGEIFT